MRVANWQRSKDGTKPSRAPKPIPRPGLEPDADVTEMRPSVVRTPEELDAFLASLQDGWEAK